LYIFGGQVDGFFFNDLVAFDLNTLQSAGSGWEVLVPAKEAGADMPASRTNHTIVTWADKLYLYAPAFCRCLIQTDRELDLEEQTV